VAGTIVALVLFSYSGAALSRTDVDPTLSSLLMIAAFLGYMAFASVCIWRCAGVGCVFHATWTLSPEQTGQSERSDAGVVFYS